MDEEKLEKLMKENSQDRCIVWAIFLGIFFCLLVYIGFNTVYLIQSTNEIHVHFDVMESMFDRAANFQ